jgi:hypothetical protein
MSKQTFLYSKFVTCNNCNSFMRGSLKRDGSIVYRCNNGTNYFTEISEESINRAIEEKIASLALTDEVVKNIALDLAQTIPDPVLTSMVAHLADKEKNIIRWSFRKRDLLNLVINKCTMYSEPDVHVEFELKEPFSLLSPASGLKEKA